MRRKKSNVVESVPPAVTTRLIPVTEWPHPWPSEAGLRKMIFEAETNGASAWIRRSGRRVLVDEAAFFRWIEERGEKHG